MPITHFKTQKSLKGYIQTLIHKIGLCESIKDNHNEYYQDFIELFKRHPAYPEKIFGMIDVKIRNNPKYGQKELYILYENGNCQDISYNLCITGKPKNNLKVAMRVAIEPQIIRFRNISEYICQTETCKSTDDLEVDHEIHFEKLYDDFMAQYNGNIPSVFDENVGHLKCFKKEDREFETKWYNYHEKNAKLRMLCKTCNRCREKYKK